MRPLFPVVITSNPASIPNGNPGRNILDDAARGASLRFGSRCTASRRCFALSRRICILESSWLNFSRSLAFRRPGSRRELCRAFLRVLPNQCRPDRRHVGVSACIFSLQLRKVGPQGVALFFVHHILTVFTALRKTLPPMDSICISTAMVESSSISATTANLPGCSSLATSSTKS